jgi:hypothetical protein
MVSMVQLKKVHELTRQGYYGDEETQKLIWTENHGAMGGPTYLKDPKDHKIVVVDSAGNVTAFKPTPKRYYRAPFGPM